MRENDLDRDAKLTRVKNVVEQWLELLGSVFFFFPFSF